MHPWLLALALLFALAAPAMAHTLSESHSNWRINGRIVHVTFTLPDQEARRLAPAGQPMPSQRVVGAYLSAHLFARSQGKACL
jgi:hypothetical protein